MSERIYSEDEDDRVENEVNMGCEKKLDFSDIVMI